MPTCRSPDTNLSSQAPHLISTQEFNTCRAFLSKDSSDEEASSEEDKEEEEQADDELQKPPARRFINASLKSNKKTPSDDDDGDQESSDESLFAYQHIAHSAFERIKAASLEDSSSGDKRRELCSILVHDKKQSARPESAFASTAPFPQSKKHVRFDCQEDLESECESPEPSTRETNSPASGGDKSDVMDSINLKCMKSIKRAFPKLLQPPWSYRTSLDKLKEFVNLTHSEKWAARTAFQ